ncbi:MAG: hypothetical protein U0667_07785 [Chloroflexota bacterium]
MDPVASSLVALVAAAGAALVACVAVGFVLSATRMTRRSAQARVRLDRATTSLREDAPRLRGRLEAAVGHLQTVGDRWVATDRAMADMTTSLATLRGSLERITQGRLAMLIRGAGIASKVAQFALLWR